jgi:hypothetical protein
MKTAEMSIITNTQEACSTALFALLLILLPLWRVMATMLGLALGSIVYLIRMARF